MRGPLHNAMSVDVEDWFQVAAFEKVIPRKSWHGLPRRLESNLDRILALLSEHEVRATFFMLGWLAKRHPILARRIVKEGHELASHGYGHQRVDTLTPAQFRRDVRVSKQLLEDLSGACVQGYRAPTYSIGPRTPWAGDILAKEGYRYSSSIYPVRHDLYGWPSAPRTPHSLLGSEVLEVPIATVRVLGRNWPCGGGGYFRLFPYPISKWAIERVNRDEELSCVFYFHPWELDPGQPRVGGANWKSRFRHYLNLGRTERRLTHLLKDFHWGRIDEIFPIEGG